MTGYATDHAGALADVRDAGTALTFTRTIMTEDPEAGTMTPAETTVKGQAVRIQVRSRNDQQLYRELGLIESEAPRLLFVPDTYGDEPQVGDTCSWNGREHTVRNVDTLAPDGTPILSKVVISR